MKKPSKIYTKTGDKGETSLIGGGRVIKYHPRVEAYGTIDELNSYIGLLRELLKNKHDKAFLLDVQKNLFTVQTLLAAADKKTTAKIPVLKNTDVAFLEKEIDTISAKLLPLKSFLIPGGSEAIAYCHIIRCVCRSAERLVVKLSKKVKINAFIIPYLNRLSDYLFVLARKTASEEGIKENYLK